MTFIEMTDNFTHTGANVISDLSGYCEVKVRQGGTEMIDALPNCCIDNSFALAEFDDQKVVQGFIAPKDLPFRCAIFHYWNYCEETKTYWDSTPMTQQMRYFIKEQK